jgi:hypothetical protein
MKMHQHERLIVVHNEKSSRAAHVPKEVFGRLDAAAVKYVSFATPSPQPEDNIAAIASTVRPGDLWMFATGDGTANAGVNGLLQANQPDVTAAFLGDGNFNDMANTFSGRYARRDPLRLLASEQTTTLHPLEIRQNGEHWRYAALYATLGWTALAAHEFDDPAFREKIQHSRVKNLRSLGHLGVYYFKTRRHAALPGFIYEDEPHVKHNQTTDVGAVNGPVMARVIRSGQPMYKNLDYLQWNLNVTPLVKNIPFLTASALNHMPGKPTRSSRLIFDHASRVPVQTDGEFTLLDNVESIEIQKNAALPTLQVIEGRRDRKS